QCSLCEANYDPASLTAAVTVKRVLDARQSWGVDVSSKRFSAPSLLYSPAKLCKFCSQFFPS
ncbi:hypothetical protein JKP88DRAFT_152066, partial [Tribonema minus]